MNHQALQGKFSSRLSEQRISFTYRMESEPRSVHADHSKLGLYRDRPFCVLKNAKVEKFFFIHRNWTV